MGIDIRLPNINGRNDSEQLAQIKSYLYQFASQLQWALGAVEAGNGSNTSVPTTTPSASTKEDPTSNFNQLKGLIIKSADIVNAFYDEITKLADQNGKYVASSDFGDFVEKTNNLLYVDDKSLRQELEDVQQIFDEDGNIRKELLVNGHIFSGIIEYAKDGEAIVGIEIGQTTTEDGEKKFNQFARFTANKLSFYDANAIEVAYISDFKMVITEAWVKGNLQLGSGFILDTTNGIALRPI
jgi:hypothetical protein